MRDAGCLSLAGHRGRAVWRNLTPTVEHTALYMQMKPKHSCVPLDRIAQKSQSALLVVDMHAPRNIKARGVLARTDKRISNNDQRGVLIKGLRQ